MLVGERDDGEAELAEEDGSLEDGGFAHLGQGLFALEALDRLDADDGVPRDRFASTETTLAVPTAALPTLEW